MCSRFNRPSRGRGSITDCVRSADRSQYTRLGHWCWEARRREQRQHIAQILSVTPQDHYALLGGLSGDRADRAGRDATTTRGLRLARLSPKGQEFVDQGTPGGPTRPRTGSSLQLSTTQRARSSLRSCELNRALPSHVVFRPSSSRRAPPPPNPRARLLPHPKDRHSRTVEAVTLLSPAPIAAAPSPPRNVRPPAGLRPAWLMAVLIVAGRFVTVFLSALHKIAQPPDFGHSASPRSERLQASNARCTPTSPAASDSPPWPISGRGPTGGYAAGMCTPRST